MRYAVLGIGGVGGALGAALVRGGKEVTLLAHAPQAGELCTAGLHVFEEQTGAEVVLRVDAQNSETYRDTPDVVFVCVKAYALESAAEVLACCCSDRTLVIPLLNGLDVAERLSRLLPSLQIVEGSIAVFSRRDTPTRIVLMKNGLRMMMGTAPDASADQRAQLFNVAADLQDCGITVRLSLHPKEELFEKFIGMSPRSAIGVLYGTMLIRMQTDTAMYADYVRLLDELVALGTAMGVQHSKKYREQRIQEVAYYTPTQCTSLYRDWASGLRTEAETILYVPVRLGRRYGLSMPTYEKAAKIFGYN